MILPHAKKWLRAYLLHVRSSIPERQRKKMSQTILRRLVLEPSFKKAKTIGIYIGFGSEIDTAPMIKRAWRDKKKVVVPSTRQGLSRPCFEEYRPQEKLRRTKWGTWEPAVPKRPEALSGIDLMIVPGLGFDGGGHRVGFGGGFYDRVLAKMPKATHVGLFFSRQEIYRCPRNGFDQRLDVVITEKGVVIPK